ncbi:hypothetical protein FCH28_09730 [Streptomyces piniterrae]|uniref:Uncharacterized protein n=1 Tax=Streptomyces piniterrae TaxID=2571125 RepID=A0A4U0NMH1_9ACTN|nr:hypothetical protein [Streptomyces piniterrae]TJZ55609.1 hypothetical protein FCH28_09730 [Streptomyces piniterrae]
MATRSKPEPQPTPAAVRTKEYAAGTGWDIGQTAPDDAFRALDAAGSGEPTGPVVHSHPGGYARQIVAKGGLITEGVKRELDAAASTED